TCIYTLSLHDALPISQHLDGRGYRGGAEKVVEEEVAGPGGNRLLLVGDRVVPHRALGAPDERIHVLHLVSVGDEQVQRLPVRPRSEEHTSELQSPYDL